MNQTSFNGPTPQAAAAKNGLWVGLMWLTSFVCVTNGIRMPLLMAIGHFVGLYSMVATGRMLYRYRAEVIDLPWLGRLGYVFLIGFYAALITTMGQYLYFTFWDNGQFVSDLSTLMADPHYINTTKQMMPNFDPELILEQISKMSTRQMLIQFSFTNICIATFGAPLAMFFGSIIRVKKQEQ